MTPIFRFGDIIGMDHQPELHLMVLCPVAPEYQRSLRKVTWWAAVLIDSGIPGVDGWEVGRIVTVSPGASGIVIVEEPVAGE